MEHIYENQLISDWLYENAYDPDITSLEGRRLIMDFQFRRRVVTVTSNNQFHARARKLTLELRRKFPNHQNDTIKDHINSDTALAVYVAGAWRSVVDHRVFQQLEDDYRIRGLVTLPIRKVRYNRVYNTINVTLYGKGRNEEFYIPKRNYKFTLPDYQVGDLITLKNNKYVSHVYGNQRLGHAKSLHEYRW